MQYTYSCYNIVLKEDDGVVYLYNSFSGALCKLEKDVHNNIVYNLLSDTNKCDHFDELLKQGFIKPADLDEYNKIVLNERTAVLAGNRNSLTYVLVPTLACNLKCEYCFENGYRNGKIISDEKLSEVVNHILSRTNTEIKEIHISWFGGEPLIAYDKIVKFSELLIPQLQKKQIIYHSSMISNGILLTPEKAKILSEVCKVKQIQITVDGTKEVYCARKHATPKQFEDLFKNIYKALEYVKISIRLNCDGNNYDDLKAITKQLLDYCENNKDLSIYLAKLVDYMGCGGPQFFSQDIFDNKRIEFDKYVSELQGKHYKPRIHKYHKSFCGLFKLNNLVVGPDGELYKCEHHVGQVDKIIGDINFGLYYNDFLMRFIENKPQEQCKSCKIFPICLGGCPAQKFDLPQNKSCFYSESYIKQIVERYIKD